MSRQYDQKPGADVSKKSTMWLPDLSGSADGRGCASAVKACLETRPMRVAEIVALLQNRYSPLQIRRSIQQMCWTSAGVLCDGRKPGTYRLDKCASAAEVPRRYAPGIAPPLTLRDHDLMAHMELNKR